MLARSAALLACTCLCGAGIDNALAQVMSVPPAPNIPARSYILLDHGSGQVIAEKQADEKVEPASITKIMTVYVAGKALAAGLISLDDEVLVSEKAWRMEGSRMFIEVGTRVTVDALLDGIIVQSGNDASVALAEHVSGSEDVFAGLMNQHARELGMHGSAFANATGLPDPGTYVTARDVATLSSAMITEFPELYARFAEREFVYNDIHQPNRNRLLARDDSVDGIKTGHTESAGYCLASSAQRDGMRLVAAVMGTASDAERTEASYQMLTYGFRFFETRDVYAEGEVVASPRVWTGVSDKVGVTVPRALTVTVPRGRYDEIDITAEIDQPVRAPVAKGQQLGTLTVALDDDVVRRVPLLAAEAVAEGSFFSRMYDEVLLLLE